jgi:hypothetical protein
MNNAKRISGRLLQQVGNTIRRLSAFGDPVVNTLTVDANALFVTTRNRVKETDTLNETTVTTVTAIGYYDLIKWALFGAATSHTNGYHASEILVITNKQGRPMATRIKIKPGILRRFEEKG